MLVASIIAIADGRAIETVIALEPLNWLIRDAGLSEKVVDLRQEVLKVHNLVVHHHNLLFEVSNTLNEGVRVRT